MDACGVCFKPADQLFETGNAGVYSCFKCQPLSIVPEVTIGEEQPEQSDSITILIDEEEGAEGQYRCDLCNKTFEKNQQYQNHVRNHRAERRYVCTYCSKAFSQSNNLRAHLRIHTNERPYKCTECGKAFTQVTNLNNHVRLHTGERPFVCEEPGCNKAYAQVTNLNQHRKRHLNGRPVEATYDCTVCGAQFEQRNHMYMHRREEHADAMKPVKPFSISAPGKMHKSNMVLPLVVPFTCEECGEQFPLEKQLIKHTAHKHKVKPSLEPAYKCMFENCGLAFAEASQHADHLLKAHQLRVTGNFNAQGVTVRPTPRTDYQPSKRGRPPKNSAEIIVPEPVAFHFVDPKDTHFDMEVTEDTTNISSASTAKVKIISAKKYR